MLILMRSTILVGGQAVIEGVMMRVPGAYATAVRKSDGSIAIDYHTFNSITTKKSIYALPIIRGMIHLYESMKIGYQTLNWSADFHTSSESNNKLLDSFLSFLSIIFAIGLFFYIPLFLAGIFQTYFTSNENVFVFNIISGCIRIILFLTYLISISFLKDVKRLFQFHGAEHKTVYNFESGLDLTILNAQTFSTKHPRCGTSFIFIIMLVTIFTYAMLDSIALLFIENLNYYYRAIFHILCLPLVSGIGYEVLKFLAKKQNNIVCKILSQPGLWLQHITTKEPSDKQLEISIYALKKAFGEKINQYSGKKYTADAIG